MTGAVRAVVQVQRHRDRHVADQGPEDAEELVAAVRPDRLDRRLQDDRRLLLDGGGEHRLDAQVVDDVEGGDAVPLRERAVEDLLHRDDGHAEPPWRSCRRAGTPARNASETRPRRTDMGESPHPVPAGCAPRRLPDPDAAAYGRLVGSGQDPRRSRGRPDRSPWESAASELYGDLRLSPLLRPAARAQQPAAGRRRQQHLAGRARRRAIRQDRRDRRLLPARTQLLPRRGRDRAGRTERRRPVVLASYHDVPGRAPAGRPPGRHGRRRRGADLVARRRDRRQRGLRRSQPPVHRRTRSTSWRCSPRSPRRASSGPARATRRCCTSSATTRGARSRPACGRW